MTAAAFLDATQEYWRERGWQSERHEVADGTHMLAGVRSTDGSRQTGLLLVVSESEGTVTGEHVKYLLSAGSERDVDTVAVTTRGDVTERATDLIEEQNVRWVDAEAVQSATPPSFDESGEFTFPTDDSGAVSTTDTSQQREGDSETAGIDEQSGSGSTGPADAPPSASTTGGTVENESPPADSPSGGNAPVDQSAGANRARTTHRSASPADRGRAAVDDLPLASGAVMGAVAFLANYLLVTVLFILEFSNDQFTLDGVAPHEYSGWLLYSAHTVKIEGATAGEADLLRVLYTGMQSPAVPKLAYYAVPLLGLVAAGYVLADRTLGLTSDPGVEGAKRGALVAIGYAVLTAIAATTGFSVSPPTVTESIAPKLDGTAALMAVGYPVVLGGLGGFVAGASR